MITFIDADSLLFKVAATTNGKYNLRKKWRDKVKDIRDVTWADQVLVGVKGTHRNFRYDILEDYKGTRPQLENKLKEKLNYLHEFAIKEGAIMARDGWETDDEVAQWVLEAWHSDMDYCIAHIDKDLDMLPGDHYDYNKDTHYEVDLDTCLYNFYHQLLTGDRSDNIPGVRGIGPVRASNHLAGRKPEDYYKIANGHWGHKEKMEKSARCLFMGDPELFTWDLRELYERNQDGQEEVCEVQSDKGSTSIQQTKQETRRTSGLVQELHEEEPNSVEQRQSGTREEESSHQEHGQSRREDATVSELVRESEPVLRGDNEEDRETTG